MSRGVLGMMSAMLATGSVFTKEERIANQKRMSSITSDERRKRTKAKKVAKKMSAKQRK